MKTRIITDEKKCVGCYACIAACIAAHHVAEDETAQSFRRIKAVREGTDFQKNVCISCLHCGKCINVCLSGALYRDEQTGLVLSDKARCVGCGSCAPVCPQQVIRYDENGKIEKCDGCHARMLRGEEPACVRNCYMRAIRVVRTGD